MSIDKNILKEIVLEQKDYIENISLGVEREEIGDLENKLNLPHILVISGMRRVGKSTLLAQIIKKFYYNNEFYYINFEDERFIDFKAEDFNRLFEVLLELFGRKKTFFLDEIQNIKGWERFVRRFQDNNFKFIITGSSANLLSRELGTKLTGRYLSTSLYPFSFKEFLTFKGYEFTKNSIYKTASRAKLNELFESYLVYGGLPEYLRYENKEILKQVYDNILYRDIVVRFGLEDVKQLRDLSLYLLSNTGNLFTYNKIKKLFNFGSVTTAKNYVTHLEDSFLVNTLSRLSYSLKSRNVTPRKVYPIDNGLVNSIAVKFSRDREDALENIVFWELKRAGKEVYYYKTKNGREVDFVIKENKTATMLIQVSDKLSGSSTKERELRSLVEAMDELSINKALILTTQTEEKLEFEDKAIEIRNIVKWILYPEE